jgi:polyphosphate kinase 2 (PPK2 family)
MAKSGRKAGNDGASAVPDKVYRKELRRLQAELVKVQQWLRQEQVRLVVIFEGRDAAGKGGRIKRITQYLNPRFAQIVALPAPTERDRTQWYFQRYAEHLPAAGHAVLFDRSCTTGPARDDKHRAHLNMMAHLLSTLPYREVALPELALPHRPAARGYVRPPRDVQNYVPDHTAALLG